MLFFNMKHVWVDSPFDPRALSGAEMEGRRQVRAILSDLRRNVPGFENAFIARAGVQIGVRETRHLRGRYTLTREDVVAGRCFEDGIARCAYEIDIHPLVEGERTDHVVLDPGIFYEIPYRCLVPASGPENLLVACRALSADHAAHGSLRIMPTMTAVGEAAGIAAARAAGGEGGRVVRVDGEALKQELIAREIMGDPPGGSRPLDSAENSEDAG